MKAWEMASRLYKNAKPVILGEEEQTWEVMKSVSGFYDQLAGLDWKSNVPGSGAPETIMVAAVQALENRGYIVEDSEELLMEGLRAYDDKDFIRLHQISALMRKRLLEAKKNPDSPYWSYKYYHNFEEYEKNVNFPDPIKLQDLNDEFRDRIKAAWLSQLIGAAMGTQLEGYTRESLREAFGDFDYYLREPNTYNDDLTFQLAFLEAFNEKGADITSKEIALKWAGLVPAGWSAEEFALRNIKQGVFPPESGRWNNPFNEWIGAQMRGAICGMVAPGDPGLAARLAWTDGEVSHANNGILGEVFNAVMLSLAFVEKDTRKVLLSAIELIPKDSEYRSVLDFALHSCRNSENWEAAMEACEEKYIRYNWIHSYPNACAEVIALYFGEGDFTKTLKIISQAGVDVDCNAAQIMPVIGIREGTSGIPERYMHEAFLDIKTYMRYPRHLTLDELVDATVKNAVR
ncbi:MAG TPA: ADP-ribosylglycohydrolase family protein [Gudongella oleilytica]|nr:ADP-ribosylglycohydrolase family protein [Gudongella oleilytica]